MSLFFHYGERKHLEQFLRDGSFQLKPLRSYDTSSHGRMIGDDFEGKASVVVTDENYSKLPGKMIPFDSMFNAPIFGPGSKGNVFIENRESHNYIIYCMSRLLHADLCRDFSPNYDAALIISSPFVFLHEVTNAFVASNLVDRVDFVHVADVHYRSRNFQPEEIIREEFIKEEKYKHQYEVRAIWNVGNPESEFYRFKIPRLIGRFGILTIDDMPRYDDDDPSHLKSESFRMAMSRFRYE